MFISNRWVAFPDYCNWRWQTDWIEMIGNSKKMIEEKVKKCYNRYNWNVKPMIKE